MPLAWLLTRFPRRPLVFSPLISLYDTLVDDRRSVAEGSVMSRFLRWLDRQACAKADLVLLDTEAHIDYFVQAFNLPRKRFARVFVGAVEPDVADGSDLREGAAAKEGPDAPEDMNGEVVNGPDAYGLPSSEDAPFRVQFVGKFTPLHGLPFMLEAAKRLKDVPDIVFHSSDRVKCQTRYTIPSGG